MGTTKVILDFSPNRYSDSELIIKTAAIQLMMTGNVFYLEPDPPLLALSQVFTNFTVAVSNAENRGRREVSFKNAARLELENLLRLLGLYVQKASFGIEDRILTTGFDTAKKREVVGPLPQPTSLVVNQGINSGEVSLECNVIPKAAYYEFEYTDLPLLPNRVWVNVSSTKHQVKIQGLTKGLEYLFRAAGKNSDPSCNWSAPITRMVI